MTIPRPIPEDLAEMIAARLRVIGDSSRIRILDQLRDGELSVTTLAERLETSQQNVSKHLGILHQAGIVSRRKDGTSALYSVADESVYELCEQICGGLQSRLAELSEMVEGFVRPGKIPSIGRGVDAMPGDSVAHRHDAELRGQVEIAPPRLVVSGELVFVERSTGARIRRRDEGVLDAGEPEESAGAQTVLDGSRGPIGRDPNLLAARL